MLVAVKFMAFLMTDSVSLLSSLMDSSFDAFASLIEREVARRVGVAVGTCVGETVGVEVGRGGVVTGGEQFRVRIESAFLATTARRMMSGQEAQKVITGTVVRGDGGFNTGYGWHMKPNTIQFADVTIEACDGRPSDVQSDITYWVDTVKRYCPWGGRFVSEIGRSL